MSFERIVLSTDENENFIYFLPLVAAAWKKFFPKVEVDVAFVTSRFNADPLVLEMRKYANVKIFHKLEGYPSGNLAKVARFYLATTKTDSVCMIEDMDTIPLQTKFFADRTSQREEGKLLAVGAEVLKGTDHEGKFPISTMTAEASTFMNMLNPKKLSFPELVASWRNLRIFDHKEDITNPASSFSDESLMRALISRWDKDSSRVTHVDRAIDIHNEWIDRSWWSIDEFRLSEGGYVTCNMLRPLVNYYNEIEPLIDSIMSDIEKKDLNRYISKVESLL